LDKYVSPDVTNARARGNVKNAPTVERAAEKGVSLDHRSLKQKRIVDRGISEGAGPARTTAQGIEGVGACRIIGEKKVAALEIKRGGQGAALRLKEGKNTARDLRECAKTSKKRALVRNPTRARGSRVRGTSLTPLPGGYHAE